MRTLSLTTLLSALGLFAQTPVLTYHNDNARSGANTSEMLLSPANIATGKFGKRFTYEVDGALYAQPLYMPRVTIDGKLHNVVFAATAHDSIYAFDADDPADGQPLWQVSFLNSAAGVTSVPAADVNCPVLLPEVGIVGTPVIDAQSETLYAIVETKEPGPSYVFRLHALDITSGAERPASPVVMAPAGFVPLIHKQRGALLLANGLVYSEWSSHCDLADYHGWLIANDAATLNQVAVFNTTPNGKAASLWNAGAGPAADASGNVFVVTANGDFDVSTGGTEYGDSVLRMNPMSLAVADYFTPFNQSLLDNSDLDLGSAGAVLLPDEAGSAAHPHLLVTEGKEGRFYLLDRDHLGGAQSFVDSSALASLPGYNTEFGSAAWFNGRVYIENQTSPLFSFPVSQASVSTAGFMQSAESLDGLGATPAISANGNQDGVVWVFGYNGGQTLRAFDANTLTELFDSATQASDTMDTYVEFGVPTIANGKVYVGTQHTLTAYGELNRTTPVVGGVANAASYETQALAPGSIAAIFGTGLSLITASAPNLPLPVALADVLVEVNGYPAPVLYISPGQINALIPLEVPSGPAQVVVKVAGAESAAFGVTIQSDAPGIFSVGGTAAALNLDYTVNGPNHPAAGGSAISVYLTGSANLSANVADGTAPPVGTPAMGAATVTATIGGQPVTVLYSGPAPNYTGLLQINVTIPVLATGSYPLVITVNGQVTNSALVFIQGT